MFTPEISGAEGQPIIKQSRVCYADRQHPGMVFLRLRQCLGCPSHGFPGASAVRGIPCLWIPLKIRNER